MKPIAVYTADTGRNPTLITYNNFAETEIPAAKRQLCDQFPDHIWRPMRTPGPGPQYIFKGRPPTAEIPEDDQLPRPREAPHRANDITIKAAVEIEPIKKPAGFACGGFVSVPFTPPPRARFSININGERVLDIYTADPERAAEAVGIAASIFNKTEKGETP